LSDLVLDTNIVLDLLVFDDAATGSLRAALAGGTQQWVATAAMREELVRVLDYPQIVKSLAHHGRTADGVLAQFDVLARIVDAAPKAPVTCKDPDDQKFIDLAVTRGAALLSKDHAVLCMSKRLFALGVRAGTNLAKLDLEATSISKPPSTSAARYSVAKSSPLLPVASFDGR
jgi:putative PIN family toxin of toxin-antitoxin system